MATPASPPITMANLRTEFGGTTSTPLSAYVRGGAYVPNTGANAGVPTSVPIRLNQLCGAAAVVYGATLSPTYLYNSRVGAGLVTSGSCTCTVVGSSGSLTYAWSRVSGAITINIGSPTSASTTFYTTFGPISVRTAYFKCTVTDSILGVVATTNVQVDLESA